ncbi:peroxisomal carnitine O-octanoyltransferase isoform X2 [Dendrobates tinctorius]|uniref:peroxisomal carnitine O-octanoyltransferase isoform X2 n=1 Tax=Dendrobates tinctorius TaxID=92724 RepID=UPI003CC9B119
MENRVFGSVEERTFQYQDTLPPLPVPPLEESLSKYCESVKPFLNEEEYKMTCRIVKDFGNGIGKELHQKLLERARTRKNWILLGTCHLYTVFEETWQGGCSKYLGELTPDLLWMSLLSLHVIPD